MTSVTDRLSDTDLTAIGNRQTTAEAVLTGRLDRDDDPERAEHDLSQLVVFDVPRMLCELEQRDVDWNSGYVAGLRKAVRWLRWLAGGSPDTGLDPATMARLVAGADAMAKSAAQRLGVDTPEEGGVRDG